MAVETARRALDVSAELADEAAPAAVVRQMRRALVGLLEVVEAQPLSARLSAQHDEEFLNLARATRMEIHAARGALSRLEAFERALTGMLYPEDGS